MKSLWRRISNNGVTIDMPTGEKRKYMGFNQVIALGWLFAFVTAIVTYVNDFNIYFVYGAIGFILTFIITFFIVSRGRLKDGYHFTIISLLTITMIYNSFHIPDLRSYFIFIPIASGIYNILDDPKIIRRYNWSFFIIMGLNVITYLLRTPDPDINYLSVFGVFIACFYLLVFTMAAFRNDMGKYIKIINNNAAIIEEAEELANIANWRYNIRKDRFHCSQKLCEMFGLDNQTKLKFERDFLPLLPIFYQNQLKEVIKTNPKSFVFKDIFTKETTNIKSWFRFNAKIRFEEKGNTTLLGSIQDITETVNQQEKIEQLMGEVMVQKNELERKSYDLQRSNKELEQFAYIASHDLQEPLRMVGNFVQLLEEEFSEEIGEDGQLYVKYAVDGVTRMSEQIQNLLEYSRVGKAEMRLQKVDINRLLTQKLLDLSMIIKEKNATIKVLDIPEIIMAEPNLLSLVFYNLINNALKFNQSKHPLVEISSVEHESEWQFSVKDNGIGISKASQGKIFVIFKRLHRKEEYKGTGIGLAMVKRIIEKHKGRIWVASELGQGSTFYFTISK